MAEHKSNSGGSGSAGIFARRVQKQLSRAQEKVLQKLGKTVETKDEQFEQCSQNLNKQQSDGNRLFKDVKAYFNAVKAMRETSKRLSQSLRDVYEEDWQGGEDLAVITESEDLLWNDYEEKLADQAVRTMENYISQFPEAKERVAKRGRKLVDYDSSRHHLEALQNAKKKDELKISKAEEEFHKAQTVFEDINRELREELPVLYQSRIGCYVTVFQNLSNLRDVFYREMSTLNNNLYNLMKKLETQHSDKAFIIKGWESSSAATGTKKRRSVMISAPIPCNTAFPSDHVSNRGSIQKHKGEDQEKAADEKSAGLASSSSGDTSEPEEAEVNSDSSSDSPAVESDEETVCAAQEEQKQDTVKEDQEKDGKGSEPEAEQSEENTSEERLTQTSELAESHEDSSALPSSELEDLPVGNENDRPVPAPRTASEKRTSLKLLDTNGVEAEPAGTNENPPGFLYKAVALESHASAEEGELQFVEGDVILVVAYGEELPEGKARGVKENDWIQHRDELNHTGFIMENHIQRVDAK